MLVTDQMGYAVNIPPLPQRIISLVPSQTELLFDLGLGERIVGVTKFCIHPREKVKNIPVIGGTKNFNFATIAALQPDLIIGNKEENYQEGIIKLKEIYPVWMSDIINLEQALAMIQQIGNLTGTATKAQVLIQKITASFQNIPAALNIPTAYFIWRAPYLSVGHNTFIHQMLHTCGLGNVFIDLERYPEIPVPLLQTTRPKLIMLSSEPYPFRQKHIQEFQQLCPEALVKLVDGELFSWYGSRLQYSAVYFTQLIREIKSELHLS